MYKGHGIPQLVAINVGARKKRKKMPKHGLRCLRCSYSDPFAALRLLLSPMGQYRSILLNMGSTDFDDLHLLYTSKWAV
jgi:hypothetical protein